MAKDRKNTCRVVTCSSQDEYSNLVLFSDPQPRAGQIQSTKQLPYLVLSFVCLIYELSFALMAHYVRILGIDDPDISVDNLIYALESQSLSAQFSIKDGEQANKWSIIQLANSNGDIIAQIERNPVIDGELGREELDEFIEQIKDEKPASAVKWLTMYFEKIKVIYAFQMLNAAFEDGNFEIISAIKTEIWNNTGGILQADLEGFTNEDGYHILWQFSDTVTGKWNCAVRNMLGQWERFQLDLGNREHRNEFQEGKVPKSSLKL